MADAAGVFRFKLPPFKLLPYEHGSAVGEGHDPGKITFRMQSPLHCLQPLG
ncbi:hypothetical protein [Labrenzia sp. VG12]|uniref:hypothetical protein n=1 Tax=Labrenzia sp. VG12 TaxID=2021862 RepID=UPI0012FD406C|nr:hypothetical protein [Labrenzia sp. VG12]